MRLCSFAKLDQFMHEKVLQCNSEQFLVSTLGCLLKLMDILIDRKNFHKKIWFLISSSVYWQALSFIWILLIFFSCVLIGFYFFDIPHLLFWVPWFFPKLLSPYMHKRMWKKLVAKSEGPQITLCDSWKIHVVTFHVLSPKSQPTACVWLR